MLIMIYTAMSQAEPASQLRLCALASGSKGNCIYIGCGSTNLLIDCGISMTSVFGGLNYISGQSDAPVNREDISGILVTHEHIDHIRSCASISRKLNVPVYSSAPTLAAINLKCTAKSGGIAECNQRAITPGQDFYIGDLNITPFKTPHDAACSMGFRIDAGAASVAIATDIGKVSDSWLSVVEGAQIVLLEANHDEDMLREGAYPEKTKHRILSDRGHLSNEACARVAARLAWSGTRMILLSHISENNNLPKLAFETVCDALRAEGFIPGRNINVGVLSQAHESQVFCLNCI